MPRPDESLDKLEKIVQSAMCIAADADLTVDNGAIAFLERLGVRRQAVIAADRPKLQDGSVSCWMSPATSARSWWCRWMG